MATKEETKPTDAKAKAGKKEKLSKNVEKLVDEISKLSVMELSELVNALQDKLGVSAAAPVAAAAPAASDAPAEGGAQGGGAAKQTVVITGAGDNKISVIKAIREIDQNVGLKEAKDMTESLPVEVLKDAKADDAKSAAEKLKAAGATVELK
ncbi:50S ribosomal protein L7/L12 [Patescibacteria group bacterium]|nr:50S ribosomal protein L7/L12 [Patescibacteria group bacterium]